MSDPLREAYIAAIEAENDALRAQIYDLQREFGLLTPVPVMFGLTPSESKIVSLLIERNFATKNQLMTALMAGRPSIDQPELKIVDVYICKARKKLKLFNIEIATAWGCGYLIDAPNKAKIAAYLQGHQQAAE